MKTQRLQTPIAKQMYNLKLKSSLAIAGGRYKEARVAQKDFAKLAIQDFSAALNTPEPFIGSHPWYSNYTLNSVKFGIYNLFTKKTPEEKQYKNLVTEYYDSIIRDVYQ